MSSITTPTARTTTRPTRTRNRILPSRRRRSPSRCASTGRRPQTTGRRTARARWTSSRLITKGREPDKQWITIDLNPSSPHFDRIYAMWTVFDSIAAKPFVSFADAHSDGTHTAWSAPQLLPTAGNNPQGDTYLLPHVDGNGTVYTTVTNFEPKQGFCCTGIILDKSTEVVDVSVRVECHHRRDCAAAPLSQHQLPGRHRGHVHGRARAAP